MNVPFGDLRRDVEECATEVRQALDSVLASGWFILGRELERFEVQFSAYLGDGAHAVGVGSGTEAIHLALVAAGVGHGDYVVTVPNTAVPTVSAISAAGAAPLLVDVDVTTLTMDPERLREVVAREKPRLGDRLKVIVPVHLYGQSAAMDPILAVAREFDLAVIEDACQAHGAEYHGRKVGTIGDFGTFSFYPSKNLGCYGDGGAVVARTAEDAERLKMLRNYGQENRYYHTIKGFNSRLDEMQAAVLSVKLPSLDGWNVRRRHIAQMYDELITNPAVTKPRPTEYSERVWHLYVVRHPERDDFMARLADAGVGTLIHYPVPIHLQKAYADLAVPRGAHPVSEAAAAEVLSLPMFPQLTDAEIRFVCDTINADRN